MPLSSGSCPQAREAIPQSPPVSERQVPHPCAPVNPHTGPTSRGGGGQDSRSLGEQKVEIGELQGTRLKQRHGQGSCRGAWTQRWVLSVHRSCIQPPLPLWGVYV